MRKRVTEDINKNCVYYIPPNFYHNVRRCRKRKSDLSTLEEKDCKRCSYNNKKGLKDEKKSE